MSDPVGPAVPQPDPALEAEGIGDAESPHVSEAAPVEATSARRRHPFYLRGRRLRLPSSRRGLFALLLVLAGLGGVAVFSTVSLIQWTETADFCGRCHTMSPELQAYHAGPHKSVACAECHVEPGIMGWIKAKINGTKQLIDVVIGSYPTPIPPPDHADMPPASETCEGCHGVTRTAVTDLKTETVYSEDEANTPQFVGLMIRPSGGDPFDVSRSVHWHVLQTVTFESSDPRAQTIDEVEVTQPDGSVDTYIAQAKVRDAGNVGPDVAAVKATDSQTTMSCYDCHNRVGHDIANPRTGLDEAMTTGAANPTAPGAIDPTLPYIKREGMQILWAGYQDTASADAAAEQLHQFYSLNYPTVAQDKPAEIDEAITEIKTLYRLTATPEMKVSATTYPNNLGHLDFPGCFRCHDGAHYKVVNGAVTKQVIPSTCDTCHTFPQIGPKVASLPLGQPPTTHNDALWVFDHKSVAKSVDPGGQECGQCHAKDFCVNCHSTGAVTVDHDEMATNHAAVIRRQGNSACAYCHQPVFCASCHGKDQVLPITTPFSSAPQSSGAPLELPSASPGAGASSGAGVSSGTSSGAGASSGTGVSSGASSGGTSPGTSGIVYPLAPSG
jgi:nitrate/TMAO reductase-like tetraheme cytochrome c subunit